MRPLKVVAILTACLLGIGLPASSDQGKSDILDQQKELTQIREEVEASQKKLDSLQAAGVQISQKVAEYDQKISSDRKIIGRLNRELSGLRTNIETVSEQLEEREIMLDRLQRRYLGSVRQFYFAASDRNEGFLDLPNTELEQHRKVIYLTALVGFESQNVVQATDLLARATGELGDLTGRSKTVSKLKKRRETSVALGTSQRSREQRDLDRLRRSSREEADRVLTLKKAAEEMEAIIARLEQERLQAISRIGLPTGQSVFATLKGQLPPPFRGKIILNFGNMVDPVSRLKSFSPGVTIKGKAGGVARAVAAGTVAYAGELRGYGNFVIISHDDLYYTTYAGLDEVVVSKGQHVQAKAKVGTAAGDGVVKFEIRKGRELLDPVKWIRIESL